jgi:hypothetical protein
MSFTRISDPILAELLTERRVGYHAELLAGPPAWDGRNLGELPTFEYAGGSLRLYHNRLRSYTDRYQPVLTI